MKQTDNHNLKEKLIATIQHQGALTINQFMSFCLADPQYGYYKNHEPFGREGDFITAPEVSQMFGEMLAIWVVLTWQSLGQPSVFVLCEMGPGRGTLMDDVLRTIKKLNKACFLAAQVYLVETSPKLREKQRVKLQAYTLPIKWIDQFSHLPEMPLILIANELFDCLPIHQYIFNNHHWHERMVGVNDNDIGTQELIFCLGSTINQLALPYELPDNVQNGSIVEVSTARESLMDAIAQHIAQYRGSALIIDYGAIEPKPADTLQAMSKHQFTDPLANPGQDDLTSHVDFAALAYRAQKMHCQSAMTTQGEFLLNLGLIERAQNLGRDRDLHFQEKIRSDVARLVAEEQMGRLFKVLCVSDIKTKLPSFFKDW